MTQSTRPKKSKIELELPSWCVDRLRSAALYRRMQLETVAELILVSRLAKGSISADLRGLSDSRALHSLELVQEMIA